jgi:hypothetical protein
VTTEVQHPAAVGWTAFAAAVMFVIGVFDVIQGFVALFKDEIYVVGQSGLIITTDYTAWGWALIVWGAVLIVAALSLLTAGGFGRWFSIIVVALNMIAQFAFFPAYPLWGVVAIGLSLAVLWALTLGWSSVRKEIGS